MSSTREDVEKFLIDEVIFSPYGLFAQQAGVDEGTQVFCAGRPGAKLRLFKKFDFALRVAKHDLQNSCYLYLGQDFFGSDCSVMH